MLVAKKKKAEKKKALAKAKAKVTPLDEAKEAVKTFDEQRAKWGDMREEFRDEFPDAQLMLDKIEDQHVAAEIALGKAKAAVKKAKQSVGEFKFIQPKSSPGYVNEELLRTVIEYDGAADEEHNTLLAELYERGVIKGFIVDKDAAKVIHDSGNEVAEAIEEAWSEGGEDLTAQVRSPKV